MKPRRQRTKRNISSLAKGALFSTLTTSHAAEHSCPDGLDGWAPSSDCQAYFWCSAGSLASNPYSCVSGQLFDAEQLTCLPADQVLCASGNSTSALTTGHDVVFNGTDTDAVVDLHEIVETADGSDGPETNESSATRPPTTRPTPRPTSRGPAIYFVDFPSQSCKTEGAPSWITSEQLFTTKEECCNEMNWVALETCLGADWIESNFLLSPTKSPSLSPTPVPTGVPSEFPSWSPTSGSPTLTPSVSPSNSPNMAPTMSPSLEPTNSPTDFITTPPTFSVTVITDSPTLTPTINIQSLVDAELETASSVQDTYLVNLVGWANEGLESFSVETFSTSSSQYLYNDMITNPPTSSHSGFMFQSSSDISELILPVVADATISKQRPTINFASHQALAVDGGSPEAVYGDSNGEKFDSLVKFDVSLIDNSRPIESAVLKLYIVEGCRTGGTFMTTTDSSWQSDFTTWENAPIADGELIGRLHTVAAEEWCDVDVTSALSWHYALTGDAQFMSIRIESDENSRCLYSSMESGETVSPRMVIRYIEEPLVSRYSPAQNERPVALPDSTSHPVPGEFIVLRATDDATIVGSNPSRNFGREPNLLIAFDTTTRGIFDSLIRFDISDMSHILPRSAVLSLFAEIDCASAGLIASTADNEEWNEDDITWADAPLYEPQNAANPGGTSMGVFGPVQGQRWHAFDALSAIQIAVVAKRSAVTFRLSSGNSSACQYSSRNGGRAPKLMVAF